MERCPKCGYRGLLVDNVTGEIVCASCGYVVREKMEDNKPEWRAFTKEEGEDRSRVGAPTSLAMHDMGLSTVMGMRDASGKALAGASRSAADRLRVWDKRSQGSADRNLRQALVELDMLADKLSLSKNIAERAAYVYRKVLEKGLVRGRSIDTLITASLYAACRSSETPRTLKDAALVSGIKRKDIAKAYRLILKELDLKVPVTDPVKSVTGIAARAGISERTTRRAMEILKSAIAAGASAGKAPTGLAATSLYLACVLEGERKTQKDIAEAAGVTEVTIRNRYRGLKAILNGV
ncbi:MAG: transcription initiation factor IIB [Nitrososphaerota archaeon]|nr:transcription initiation factor IIB [Nitrososphaerota archaeon]MDG7038474.1 transcription initiation factor IIB [Nitrososphaerota archaeon]MDG7041020.1 transcription initiation factor IIB [Nitrososphaerota archaeon]MDG7042066.1 transcription initiation factor IIB [Nitrososphaerota archaeon]MDG7046955.1 transcription initiation factor IIB [Nitrososphaerota archaeon]